MARREKDLKHHTPGHKPVWSEWRYVSGSTMMLERYCDQCGWRMTKTSGAMAPARWGSVGSW